MSVLGWHHADFLLYIYLHWLDFYHFDFQKRNISFIKQYTANMKPIWPLLLLLFLADLTHASGTVTTEHVDLAGTALFDKTKLLTRVDKNVDVRYQYVLSPLSIWTQFPDMAMQFYLDFDQYVYIKYNIGTLTSDATHFLTRLMIDSEQNREFRIITGNTHYHSHFAFEQLWLSKGKHYAKVEYRSPSNHVVLTTWDWPVAVFKVRYFKL